MQETIASLQNKVEDLRSQADNLIEAKEQISLAWTEADILHKSIVNQIERINSAISLLEGVQRETNQLTQNPVESSS